MTDAFIKIFNRICQCVHGHFRPEVFLPDMLCRQAHAARGGTGNRQALGALGALRAERGLSGGLALLGSRTLLPLTKETLDLWKVLDAFVLAK